ncbi:serine/threonine-protein phosphatase 6 regulatory ankyrin repeat subunit C-like [Cucurbita pepo subsp. pepo]|uniref:serine/threonine-protein phosphatase 6 regulatory ankyrin repeat subunit C-like n=1 Tax=Cucurbita pepo subsp. pepo TaxID=3664 RepID=UPI000C9D4835|nr:serine/threonine-protein phosphatase 6 regulatory ankyrin repeat subunit C-like [Cucurbita pepo subsp. pepo]
MPPTYFPLRWESTGDQWWYASPIDWAAANGHYDLVRELLRLDSNHLIKLTSLRRIRRLETVWDDEEQYHDVAKCRSEVSRKLLLESESKKGKNSLIRAGYGGWLIYTAASAGDLGFVQELLQRNPLLVFGEGEYGVTDILYAAARSKNNEVFRILYDFAVSPRFSTGRDGILEEHIGEIPAVYKWEMMNRGVHAAARGGNLKILKDLLADCSDVLACRDAQGSTILHAAAGRGQVEVVKYLVQTFPIIKSIDHQGNTALHIAACRGQLAAVEALIAASPSSISLRNKAGETFLHKAISGFQTPAFRRLDRQIDLLKNVICGKVHNMDAIINARNNDGRTALHMAAIGNVHSDLVQLLMTARSIDLNVRDMDSMTPLDYLKQNTHSASADILIRQLISAGGMFGCHDYKMRKAIASRLKMQEIGSSPGTCFRVSDNEILLYTGIENVSDIIPDHGSAGMSSSSVEFSPYDSTNENPNTSSTIKKSGSVNSAAQRLKSVFHWPRIKDKKKSETSKKQMDEGSIEESQKKYSSSDEAPPPLRQRFSKPLALPNNKRTLSVRSNQSSPSAKKKHATGLMRGVAQGMPHIVIPHRSRSSSFSKSSLSSPGSVDKLKGICFDSDGAGPSCSNQAIDNQTPNLKKQGSVDRKLRSQYFCFGAGSLIGKTTVSKQQQSQSYKLPVVSVT